MDILQTIALWAHIIAGFINGVFMLMAGNIILMVFGGISLLLCIQDLLLYYKLIVKKGTAGQRWLSRHIGMMVVAYISAFTAFLVVNVQFDGPNWVIWLAPTFIFVPLMRYWTNKYARKLA